MNHYPTAAALRYAYGENHWCCGLCGMPERVAGRTFARSLELAHLFGGPNRVHIEANVLMLCGRCHRQQHLAPTKQNDSTLPPVTQGVLLAAKKRLGELDPLALAEITGYEARYIAGLANTPIPKFYQEEWRVWQ